MTDNGITGALDTFSLLLGGFSPELRQLAADLSEWLHLVTDKKMLSYPLPN